jgi:hypothetical protein
MEYVMIKKYIIYLLIPFFIYAHETTEDVLQKFPPGSIPGWVTPYEYREDSLSQQKTLSDAKHLESVINEIQWNALEKEKYISSAVKILDKEGLGLFNNVISFAFEPLKEDLTMYRLRVYRDGCWIDRTRDLSPKILNQENTLDQGYYTGLVAITYILTDMKVGDTIEITYCTKFKKEALLSDKCASTFTFTRQRDIKNLYFRSILPANPNIRWKLRGLEGEPQIKILEDGVQEISFQFKDLKKITDNFLPEWYFLSYQIEISEFQSWKEVAEELAPLFTYQQEEISDEMQSLVDKWKKSSPDLLSAITCAVRFVQKEIKYYSFTEGTRGFKPEPPRQVLRDRTGDCKGKTLLLKTFLDLLGVQSYPVFVHSIEKKRIADKLPKPWDFNHVILSFNLDGVTYWIDSTSTLYKGPIVPYEAAFFEMGLMAGHPTQVLVAMENSPYFNGIRVKAHFNIVSPEEVQLTSVRTYLNLAASDVRSALVYLGEEEFFKELRRYIEEDYPEFRVAPSFEILDKPEENRFDIKVCLSFGPKDKGDNFRFKVVSKFDELQQPSLKKHRKLPYVLSNFSSIEEEIIIDNPYGGWKKKSKIFQKDLPSLCTHQGSYEKEPNRIRIYQQAIYFKEYLIEEEISSYYDFLKELKSFQKKKINFKVVSK